MIGNKLGTLRLNADDLTAGRDGWQKVRCYVEGFCAAEDISMTKDVSEITNQIFDALFASKTSGGKILVPVCGLDYIEVKTYRESDDD